MIVSGGTSTICPTHVGMNRLRYEPLRVAEHLPHARGDEPDKVVAFSSLEFICPTHVGLNRLNCPTKSLGIGICPTHVGMNRWV